MAIVGWIQLTIAGSLGTTRTGFDAKSFGHWVHSHRCYGPTIRSEIPEWFYVRQLHATLIASGWRMVEWLSILVLRRHWYQTTNGLSRIVLRKGEIHRSQMQMWKAILRQSVSILERVFGRSRLRCPGKMHRSKGKVVILWLIIRKFKYIS